MHVLIGSAAAGGDEEEQEEGDEQQNAVESENAELVASDTVEVDELTHQLLSALERIYAHLPTSLLPHAKVCYYSHNVLCFYFVFIFVILFLFLIQRFKALFFLFVT